MKRENLLAIFLVLFFIVMSAVNYINRDPSTYQLIRLFSFVSTISLGIVSALYAASAYSFRSSHGKAFLAIALGMGLILLGDLILAFFNLSTSVTPLLSIADLIFAFGYLFFFLGFYTEIRLYKISIKSFDPYTKIILVLLLVTLGSTVLYLEVISFYDTSLPLLTNLSKLSFGIFDFFLVALVALILKMSLSFGNGKLFFPWLMVFFGIVSGMIGDVIYSLAFTDYINSVWPITMLNLLWVAAYLMVSYGMIRIGSIIREAQAEFTAN